MNTSRSSFSLRNVYRKSNCLLCQPFCKATFSMILNTVNSFTGEEHSSSFLCFSLPHTTNLALYFCISSFSAPLHRKTNVECSTLSFKDLSTTVQQPISLSVLSSVSIAHFHCLVPGPARASFLMGSSSCLVLFRVFAVKSTGALWSLFG